MRSGSRIVWLWSSLSIFACSACAAEAPESFEPTTVTARFALEGAPLDFADVPFPSDLYLDERGAIRLGALPSTRSSTPFFDELRAFFAARDDFSTTGAIHFGIDGPLDLASRPALPSVGQAPSLEDGVLLLDADPTSVGRGTLVPLRVLFDPRTGLLTARPARGHTLGPGHRWVAALTTSLRATDGTPIGPSMAFFDQRRGIGAHPSTAEALRELERAGIPRGRVVVATAFTTERPGADLIALRAALRARPAPVITVDRVIAGAAELDDFFGVPIEDRPGIDVPAVGGAPGERAMQHHSVERVVLGRFTAPRVVSGTGLEIGTPLRDASGAITTGDLQDTPFVLVLPRGVDLARVPVLIVQHGFNASRVTPLVLADTAGDAGMAVLGIDAFQHGQRSVGARDELHDLRGTPGPDGLYESDVATVTSRTFGLAGTPAGLALYPTYPQGAFLQFAADIMSQVRLLEDSDLTPLRAIDPSLGTLAFDASRIAYLGISLGSVIGAAVLAGEPNIRALVLAVPPGGVTDTLCEAPGFRFLATGGLTPLLGITGGFDEVTRACANDPIVDLFRWALEPADPLALAPHFFRIRCSEQWGLSARRRSCWGRVRHTHPTAATRAGSGP